MTTYYYLYNKSKFEADSYEILPNDDADWPQPLKTPKGISKGINIAESDPKSQCKSQCKFDSESESESDSKSDYKLGSGFRLYSKNQVLSKLSSQVDHLWTVNLITDPTCPNLVLNQKDGFCMTNVAFFLEEYSLSDVSTYVNLGLLDDITDSSRSKLLKHACHISYINLAKHLLESGKITPNVSRMFLHSIETNNSEVALILRPYITKEDLGDLLEVLVRDSITKNSFEIFKILMEISGMTSFDLRELARIAAENSKFEIIQYFIENDLSFEVLKMGEELLVSASEAGDLTTVLWLVKRGIAIRDEAVERAYINGYERVVLALQECGSTYKTRADVLQKTLDRSFVALMVIMMIMGFVGIVYHYAGGKM